MKEDKNEEILYGDGKTFAFFQFALGTRQFLST